MELDSYIGGDTIKKQRIIHRYSNRRHVHAPKMTGLIVAILGCIMIVIPTLIVKLPFGSAPEAIVESEEVSVDLEASLENDSIEVTVQRTDSEEVENVPLEQYVVSVVASEMPAEFADEALKAQAVAARTYIIHHLQQQDDEAVITDSTEHQVYKNESELQESWGSDFHWKMEKVTAAVLATEGEIITYEEEPITPTFFSMSNGYTEDAENYWGNALPYLKSVESKWEESHPDFMEQTVFTFGDLSEKLGIPLQIGEEVAITMSRTKSNRVAQLQVNDQSFSGKDVRDKLALRSNDFSIKQQNDHFIFTTKGYGHGVGMSQHGANGMAEEGKSYQDILHYYYQNVDIDLLSDAVPTLVSK